MPQSIRERILQALTATLQPAASANGAQFLRSPTTAVTRDASPALLLFPESETISERPNDRVERQLVVRLIALARASTLEPAETIADRILVEAHRALFTDTNLDGLCLGIKELDCDWEVEDADATAAALPARYQITYRTLAHDLTQKG